jgi:peptidoglycan/LPS O-acetylase OafA/YrhL
MEAFICISGFFGTYKILMIYDANGGKLSVKDVLKIYARRFLRLAPLYYSIFFFGWFVGPRLENAPLWYSYK